MGQSLFNVGRALTDQEWSELRSWKTTAGPDKLRRGEARDDGKVFMYYSRTAKNGERWVDPRVLDETSRQRKKARAERLDSARRECREYYARNAEQLKAQKRVRYAEDPAPFKKSSYEWRAKNAGHVASYRRAHYAKTKEEAFARAMRRYREDPVFRTSVRCRNRVRAAIRAQGFTKRSATADLVGCGWEELARHIESRFLPGMGWGNSDQWHIDHCVPLASANSEEEIYALCHFSNLQPLWAEDNLRKSDKMSYELPA